VPVHTLVPPVPTAIGAEGRRRQGPAAGLEPDPAIEPDPTRIAAMATARMKARRAARLIFTSDLNMVPPFLGV
jgi:hypothetical protein